MTPGYGWGLFGWLVVWLGGEGCGGVGVLTSCLCVGCDCEEVREARGRREGISSTHSSFGEKEERLRSCFDLVSGRGSGCCLHLCLDRNSAG